MSEHRPVTIAQISDLHCGSIYFDAGLASRVVEEVNELKPDVLLVTGDLTDMGFRPHYEMAAELISRIEVEHLLVLPGNHDARNVGYVHFESIFGSRSQGLVVKEVRILGLDSSEPDLDTGHVGRNQYRRIEEELASPDEFKIVALHHHLVPVPGTGRERNIVHDAGDLLRVLTNSGCDMVVCGHKHVPHAWRLEEMMVVNAGTACTHRLRGFGRPSYNIIEIYPTMVRIILKHPFAEPEPVAEYARSLTHACTWQLGLSTECQEPPQ